FEVVVGGPGDVDLRDAIGQAGDPQLVDRIAESDRTGLGVIGAAPDRRMAVARVPAGPGEGRAGGLPTARFAGGNDVADQSRQPLGATAFERCRRLDVCGSRVRGWRFLRKGGAGRLRAVVGAVEAAQAGTGGVARFE